MAESQTAAVGSRLVGRSVSDVMLRAPKTLRSTCTLAGVRESFRDDHVHLLLLVDGDGGLVGTLSRTDLQSLGAEAAPDDLPALGLSTLAGRTIDSGFDAELARCALAGAAERRRAVVDEQGRLIGLLCLKRSGSGFCRDADVAERARAPGDHVHPRPPIGRGRTAHTNITPVTADQGLSGRPRPSLFCFFAAPGTAAVRLIGSASRRQPSGHERPSPPERPSPARPS